MDSVCGVTSICVHGLLHVCILSISASVSLPLMYIRHRASERKGHSGHVWSIAVSVCECGTLSRLLQKTTTPTWIRLPFGLDLFLIFCRSIYVRREMTSCVQNSGGTGHPKRNRRAVILHASLTLRQAIGVNLSHAHRGCKDRV